MASPITTHSKGKGRAVDETWPSPTPSHSSSTNSWDTFVEPNVAPARRPNPPPAGLDRTVIGSRYPAIDLGSSRPTTSIQRQSTYAGAGPTSRNISPSSPSSSVPRHRHSISGAPIAPSQSGGISSWDAVMDPSLVPLIVESDAPPPQSRPTVEDDFSIRPSASRPRLSLLMRRPTTARELTPAVKDPASPSLARRVSTLFSSFNNMSPSRRDNRDTALRAFPEEPLIPTPSPDDDEVPTRSSTLAGRARLRRGRAQSSAVDNDLQTALRSVAESDDRSREREEEMSLALAHRLQMEEALEASVSGSGSQAPSATHESSHPSWSLPDDTNEDEPTDLDRRREEEELHLALALSMAMESSRNDTSSPTSPGTDSFMSHNEPSISYRSASSSTQTPAMPPAYNWSPTRATGSEIHHYPSIYDDDDDDFPVSAPSLISSFPRRPFGNAPGAWPETDPQSSRATPSRDDNIHRFTYNSIAPTTPPTRPPSISVPSGVALPSSTPFSQHNPFRSSDMAVARMRAIKQQQEREALDADRELALRLQAEEDEVEAQNARLIESFGRQEFFDCVMCLETNPVDDVAIVDGCGHRFCRDCLRHHLSAKLGEANFPILCPTCSANKNTENPGGKFGMLA